MSFSEFQTDTVVFLGGNGHCSARLGPARNALTSLKCRENAGPIALEELAYPGFEGRARSLSAEEFLNALAEQLEGRLTEGPVSMLYGTGIGGLIGLCLRARSLPIAAVPLVLQAPVLWGLERRWFPRLMRRLPIRGLLPTLFALPAFQTHFARKYFTCPLNAEMRASFFAGYRNCASLPDLFEWFTPHLLQALQRTLQDDKQKRLQNISVWWGGRDAVVNQTELWDTEIALNVKWPLRLYPEWGHYPMIDAPEEWARELCQTIKREISASQLPESARANSDFRDLGSLT